MNIAETLGANASQAWERSVVNQFTRNGVLWAVPQLTDAGIALYFNADLLDAAGVRTARTAFAALVARRRRHAAAAACPADPRRRRPGRRHTGIRRDADPSVGLQRGQRPAGHLPQLHRVRRRSVLRRRPIRVRQPAGGRGVRIPGAADQHRSRRAARVGHQRQRRLLPQSVPAGPDGAVPVRHLQPGRRRRPGAVPVGCGHAARRAEGPGQRHERHCRRWQFGHQTPRRGAAGARLDGQPAAATSISAPAAPPSPQCSPLSRSTTSTGHRAGST